MLTDIFVLGASGFVGSATVRAALQAGLSVGAWARTEEQARLLRGLGVRVTAPPEIRAARDRPARWGASESRRDRRAPPGLRAAAAPASAAEGLRPGEAVARVLPGSDRAGGR